uniref:Uncharacterized protein n=1 Tax=Kalanchoe fedtschenkoi TaxID=63787 RepID=A0A7N0TLE3_KALFE
MNFNLVSRLYDAVVLLGETPETEWQNCVPSKSGLMTVLDVLKVHKKFWPILEPVLIQLQSRWGSYIIQKTRKQAVSRRLMVEMGTKIFNASAPPKAWP